MKSAVLKRGWLLLTLVLASLFGKAQIYPIELSAQVVPPYSVYLPDYVSPGSQKLRLIVLQRDLTVQGYRLRFEMKVQLNGVTIMQTSKSAVPPPITLQPGVPTVLGGSDLAWYMQAQNLEFSGGFSGTTYEQTKSLPEGPVTILFTAYDYTRTEVQVSQSAATFFYAAKDDPPLINYPACGMQVLPINPQFINFSWLPQNTASPNSALTTNYVFSLYTVQPAGYSYQDIVQSSTPLYQTTTNQPNFIYGPAQPMLTPGYTYAWRVQAVDVTGRDVFRNNGYSDACYFIYSGDSTQGIVDYPGITLRAASAGSAQGKTWWDPTDSSKSLSDWGYTSYRIYYKKVQGNYDWVSADVSDTLYRIFDLEASTQYQARLQGYKGGGYGPYTDVVTFKTDSNKVISCADTSSMLKKSTGKALAAATSGMTLSYGPWDVELVTVQPLTTAGRFKGTCTVKIPFMLGLPLNAKFDSLTIDDSRNVTAGNITFLTQGLKNWIDSSVKVQVGGVNYGQVVSGLDTTNVTVNVSLANLDHLDVNVAADGSITSFVLPGTPPVVVQVNDSLQEVTIKDSNGNTYALDNKGNLTQLTTHDAGIQSFFANAKNLSAMDTLATGKGVVSFVDADGAYAFDSWKPFYGQASAIMTNQFEKMPGGTGDYYVAQKAIGAGQSDIVGVQINLPSPEVADSVVFATGKGDRLIYDPSDHTLNLLGGPAADAQEVYALYPKPGGGYYSLGKLLVSAYEQQNYTVVVVPVGNAASASNLNIQEISDSLNSIYNKVNIFWTVEKADAYTGTDWDANQNGQMEVSGSSWLSNTLTGEPAALISAYKTYKAGSLDNTKQYLFVLPVGSNTDNGGASLAGDMPRGTQFGFIFLNGNNSSAQTAVTAAHELGHGRFHLEHTFSNDIGMAQGATSSYPNLLDYVNDNNRHLYAYQWNQVHAPGQVMGIFENDNSSMLKTASAQLYFTPGGSPIYLPANTQIYDITDYPESAFPTGALLAFSINNVVYQARMILNTASPQFMGYYQVVQSGGVNASYGSAYQDTRTYTNTKDTVFAIVRDKQNGACGVSVFRTLYSFASTSTNQQLVAKGGCDIADDQPEAALVNPAKIFVAYSDGKCPADSTGFTVTNGTNVTMYDDLAGAGSSPFFSDSDKKRIQAQADGLANALNIKLHLYLLDNGNPNYKKDSVTAGNDANSKIVVYLDEASHSIHVQHSLTMPDWMSQVFPSVTECQAKYINSALDSLHQNIVYKSLEPSDQTIVEISVVIYRGIFGMLYCATDEASVANSSNAVKYFAGAVHELIGTVDVATLAQGLLSMGKGAITSTVDSYVSYIKSMRTVIQDIQSGNTIDAPTMIPLLFPPPMNQYADQLKKAASIAQYFVKFYFTECDSFKLDNGVTTNACPYRYGQLTVMVVPIVLTAGEWAIVKMSALMADLSVMYAGDISGAMNAIMRGEGAAAEMVTEESKLAIHDAQDASTVDETISKASAAENDPTIFDETVTPGEVEVFTKEEADAVVMAQLDEEAAEELMSSPEYKLKGTDKEWLIKIIQGKRYGKRITGLFEDGTLIEKFKALGVDLTKYTRWDEVQLFIPETSEYFVADNVFVKFGESGEILDVIVNETKLTGTTALTTRQSQAFSALKEALAEGNGKLAFEIRSTAYKSYESLTLDAKKLISVHGNNGTDELVTDALKYFKP